MFDALRSHLATALGFAACQEDHSVQFAGAIEGINDLHAAQKNGGLKRALKKYLRPQLLILDEVGYLPIDQKGADLLFQVISQRYERGSIALTTNKPFKQWATIFNNDSTIAFQIPVALTVGLWATYGTPDKTPASDQGTVWDTLWMLRCAAIGILPAKLDRHPHGETLWFQLELTPRGKTQPELVLLKAISGPGDAGEPVLTIRMPQED